MIQIRFPDTDEKKRALGFLPGRFSGTSYASGEMLVPAAALPALAVAGIRFSVDGPAAYAQHVPALRFAIEARNGNGGEKNADHA